MILRKSPAALDLRKGLSLVLGFAGVVIVFVASGILGYLNTRTLVDDAAWVTHSHEVLSALEDVQSLMRTAEAAQRGYLITGEDKYLSPYRSAVARVDERIADVERLTSDNMRQRERIPVLKSRVDARRRLLDQNIALRRDKGFDAVQASVSTDAGRLAMEAIREHVAEMKREEVDLLALRNDEMDRAYRIAVGTGLFTGLLGLIFSGVVGLLLQRAAIARQWQDWLQAGQIGLADSMMNDQRLELLSENVLRFLAEYLDAQAGAFFVRDRDDFRRVALYGVPAAGGVPERFRPGEGMLGQAARDRRAFLVPDVPDGYLTVGSSLGRGTPRHLVIIPMKEDRAVNAVMELGFVNPVDERVTELLERISDPVGAAVRAANYRSSLQHLLEETQRQAEELQAQGEELRVSNEELEEQTRALKETQGRLQLQQAELEQTNTQLEEQAQHLETQRDEASRARRALQIQARELEQASQYKSEFLANMSHELRTPLNSSLILARLLADNAQGNLTEEQVRYAETICTAGGDLLALINDILDLSKIEAGHMEIRPERIRVEQLIGDLGRTFEPLAEQKKLKFSAEILPGSPTSLETDRQRLEQVLKNLLSNAVKFTERGEVSVRVSRTSDGRVAFAVSDTGIGIPESQQTLVFEAFRQADSATNRRHGGTGLGLSISRELTRLLGGEIHLASEPGRGSTFTITIPEVYDQAAVQPPSPTGTLHAAALPPAALPPAALQPPAANDVTSPSRPPAAAVSTVAAETVSAEAIRPSYVEDDRFALTGASRVILVVEDDEAFARILYDLAHELNFQCLIATTAEEGLALAVQHLPSAVILDVGLPDNSGLLVLDRLKHDSRARHIPVHVVSAGDYMQTALSMGAIGYMAKPVKREELVAALKMLETKLSQGLRRVLIVEDDPILRDSLQKLLRSDEVETVGVGTAAECLARLKQSTFDCMVLDLSLPDASGHLLLETLAREEGQAFPPVIVYTGRDLSSDEEHQLRRFSQSIIIKGAKSPERLLDEVTLFLHQVVSTLPAEQQKMLQRARSRDAALEGRRILVVEDDVRNVFALTSTLEPRGAKVQIARNGREALEALEKSKSRPEMAIDLVLMDVMMPEMDGITATREIRKRPEWKRLPILMLTAKAMKDDQEQCMAAGASDYMAKPLDVEKLLSLVRVWMPR